MTIEGYTRRSTVAVDTQPVAIVGVDLAVRQAQGITRVGTTITIDCSYGVGSHLITPAVGEQWYVERVDRTWRLGQKIPFNDDNLLIEPVEGQTVIGGTGPIELNGNQVNIHSPLSVTGSLTLNGTNYRDNNGVLESQKEDGSWVPAGGGSESYDISYAQCLGSVRQVGYGDNVMGLKVQRSVTLTSVTYRAGTADVSGNLVVELRKNGTTVAGSSKTIAAANQVSGATATGVWSFSPGDVLTVYTSAVGTTPGRGLVADILGTVT